MKKKILLIDDSQTQLISLRLTLAKAGYEVLTANNGVEGISAAYKNRPDIIVSDIIMPEINGYQLCRLLKNDPSTSNIPIILLTSLNEKLDKFWGLRAGANAFIIKENDFTKLTEKINELVETVEVQEPYSQTKNNDNNDMLGYSNLQSRINQLLDESLIESTIINEFRNLSEYALDTTVLSKHILSLLCSIMDYDAAGIFFNDRDEKRIKKVYISINKSNASEDLMNDIKFDFFCSTFAQEYEYYKDHLSYEISEILDDVSIKIDSVEQFKSKICVPITYLDKIIGGICLYNINPNKFSQSRLLTLVLQELKVLMRLKWLNSETKYLSITDGLTGLYNRRYFQQAVEREFARARRYNTSLSIAMIDIDHFKKLNDNYGHQFGDKVIAEISSLVRSSLRKTDYVARYGGEEFVAILPETSLENAYIPFERLRKKVEDKIFEFEGKEVRSSVSIGIAAYTIDCNTETELIERADKALYEAKQTSRNLVIIYKNEG